MSVAAVVGCRTKARKQLGLERASPYDTEALEVKLEKKYWVR